MEYEPDLPTGHDILFEKLGAFFQWTKWCWWVCGWLECLWIWSLCWWKPTRRHLTLLKSVEKPQRIEAKARGPPLAVLLNSPTHRFPARPTVERAGASA